LSRSIFADSAGPAAAAAVTTDPPFCRRCPRHSRFVPIVALSLITDCRTTEKSGRPPAS